jgi:hypothetical protein
MGVQEWPTPEDEAARAEREQARKMAAFRDYERRARFYSDPLCDARVLGAFSAKDWVEHDRLIAEGHARAEELGRRWLAAVEAGDAEEAERCVKQWDNTDQ